MGRVAGQVEAQADSVARVLADQPDVVAGYLFGSRARGAAGPLSDVDVAVLFAAPPSSARRLALSAELSSALAPLRVDMVVLDDAPLPLAHRVLRDGIVVVGAQDPRRIHHAAGVMDRYLDMAPMRRTLADGLAHRIAEGRFGRR